jgi:hypothetical protein
MGFIIRGHEYAFTGFSRYILPDRIFRGTQFHRVFTGFSGYIFHG